MIAQYLEPNSAHEMHKATLDATPDRKYKMVATWSGQQPNKSKDALAKP
jgi:hypothetical protein